MLLKGGSVALSLSSYGIGGCGSLLRSTTTTCSSFQFAHFRVSLLDMGMAKLTSSATAKRRPTWLHSFCTVSSTGSADEAVAGATTTPATATATADVGAHNIKDAASLLDIRVGRILRAWRHEEADTLYVEEVDVGDPEPRIICSGLVNYIPLDHLQDRQVIVLSNLKPRNMCGVKSCGMLMAASDPTHVNVELLVPPEGAVPGERIWFGSEDEKENQPVAATPNQIQKKKIWESVQPYLKTDASCIAMLGEHVMHTSAGPVMCRSLKNASIS